MDPNVWTNYKTTDSSQGKYVIEAQGGPSAEMWCKSYNKAANKTGSSQYKAVYDSSSVPGYKYSVDNGSTTSTYTAYDTVSTTVGKGMYLDLKGQDASNSNAYHSYWLASPSANNATNVCNVNGNNANLNNNDVSNTNGVCPLDSLRNREYYYQGKISEALEKQTNSFSLSIGLL